MHETAFQIDGSLRVIEGEIQAYTIEEGIVTVNYQIGHTATVLQTGDLEVIIMNRNQAYNLWVPELENGSVIVQGPYLVRSARRNGTQLLLRGDLNASTTSINVWVDEGIEEVLFNNRSLNLERALDGSLKGVINIAQPNITLPTLSGLNWVRASIT